MRIEAGVFGTVCVEDSRPIASQVLLPSSEEMRALDAAEIARSSSSALMERAGAVCCEEILRHTQSLTHVVVLCGPGNNGGDGLVIARLLREKGIAVTAIATLQSHYTTEFVLQSGKVSSLLWYSADAAVSTAGKVTISLEGIKEAVATCSLIVDALLGTGQKDAPRGSIGDIVRALADARNGGNAPIVVSVDVPTGCNATTGALYNPHVAADFTVCVQCIKRGLLQFPARSACGEISQRDIGVSTPLGTQFSALLSPEMFRLPQRRPDTHKGECGHVVVVAGSAGMSGASVLAATAAQRSGAGLVTRCTRPDWGQGIPVPPEVMSDLLPGASFGFESGDTDAILRTICRASSTVLGPGMGEGAGAMDVAARTLSQCVRRRIPLVVDASALPILAHTTDKLTPESFIATPHPGEAARLLGCTSADVQADRFQAIVDLQRRFGGTWVLKGAGTLVWNGHEGFVVARGTPYLATAGSGDVLAGVLGALCCRLPTLSAAALGVFLHAVAGERASLASGGPILASDLFHVLPALVGEATTLHRSHFQ